MCQDPTTKNMTELKTNDEPVVLKGPAEGVRVHPATVQAKPLTLESTHTAITENHTLPVK